MNGGSPEPTAGPGRTAWRRAWGVLRIVLPVALIGWLGWTSWPQIEELSRRSVRFWPLAGAFGLLFGSLCITFYRWYLLVRALDLPFRVRDAFRLGFLGYLLNFVSLGSVGGDLFKAVFIAREQPGRRVDAVATVAVDRLSGLYGLLLVASAAILVVETGAKSGDVAAMCRIVFFVTLAATLALPVVLLLGLYSHKAAELLGRVPLLGPIVANLLTVLRRYARRPGILAFACLSSICTQAMWCLSFYLTALSLFPEFPSLADHLFIVPLAELAGALPISPSGLGTFELALKILYEVAPTGPGDDSQGFIIGLAQRLMTVVIATIGVGYYLLSRREVDELLHAAMREEQAE